MIAILLDEPESTALVAATSAAPVRLIDVIEMNAAAAAFARDPFRRFGKGVGNPGLLNYGDCLAYGAAMATGQPLLFKGADFAQTDIAAVPY